MKELGTKFSNKMGQHVEALESELSSDKAAESLDTFGQ